MGEKRMAGGELGWWVRAGGGRREAGEEEGDEAGGRMLMRDGRVG